jgi:hypothetical protein
VRHGEHYSSLNSLSPGAHRRARKLTRAAAPPPSGTGRRRSTSVFLESPITCACNPATKCTSLWTFWWPGASPRCNAGEPPPRGSPLWCMHHRYTHTHDHGHPIFCERPRLDGAYPLGLVHRGPVSRAHGAIHRACARLRPLDLRSMAQPSHLSLRAPEFL